MQPAPSAFLASAAACSDLIHNIIPSHLQGTLVPNVSDARALWTHGYDMTPPEGTAQQVQRSWDSIKVSVTAERFLENASDERDYRLAFVQPFQRSPVLGYRHSQFHRWA